MEQPAPADDGREKLSADYLRLADMAYSAY